jgi:GNAT superfamily N-acetyltransferase
MVSIRKATPADMPYVHALILELADFEKAPDAVTNTVDEMVNDCFGNKPAFGCHVAEMEGKIVGMAIYFIKYSTWNGKGLYLDDLVVTEKQRGKGIGKKLFDAYVDEAKKISANQLHWQVLDWNTNAIEFYKKLGATLQAEWLDCKMTKEQIEKY